MLLSKNSSHLYPEYSEGREECKIDRKYSLKPFPLLEKFGKENDILILNFLPAMKKYAKDNDNMALLNKIVRQMWW